MESNAITAVIAEARQSANMGDNARPAVIAAALAFAIIFELAEHANSAVRITNFYRAASHQKKSERSDHSSIASFLSATFGISRPPQS